MISLRQLHYQCSNKADCQRYSVTDTFTGIKSVPGVEVMTMKKISLLVVLSFISAIFSVRGADNMKAFPPAGEGMVRHVLQLPKQPDEDAFKVELIAGKTVLVDAVNQYFFAGKIEEETIEGWGFSRYNISKLGPMAGTLMAVDPDAPKMSRFITLGGGPFLIRYNSQLPIVVYAPEGVEVKYRVWSAGSETKVIDKG